tara:strand:+ start:122 stop:1126 length:1005 start_codon:yes stop_codon:yes gene_type:complete
MLNEDLDYINLSLCDEIIDLDSKKILITGGTGFFGQNLINSLSYLIEKNNLNSEIFILSRNAESFVNKNKNLSKLKNFNFISHDISYPIKLSEKIDIVIHAATTASKDLNENKFGEMIKTIIDGTVNVLNFCRLNDSQMLFISSGAVNGVHLNGPIDSEKYHSINPLNGNYSYHLGKLCAENLCYSFAYKFNIDVKIARCFAFVGPFLPLDKHFAIGNFIDSVLKKEKIIVNTKGESIRSYLYTSDLIIWLFKILLNGKNLFPYNVGSPEQISIGKLAELISNSNEIGIEFKNKDESPTYYVPEVNKTMHDLNISKFVDLKTSIKKTLDWHESQ